MHATWPDGRRSGMMRRQCTGDWKLDPIRRWCRQAMRRVGVPMLRDRVEQWLGITLDEVARMKQSCVGYIKLGYPFIDALERPWSRVDVKRWLLENGLPIPVKSSCVFCPYHDRATWREIRRSGAGDWEKAVAVDAELRDRAPGFVGYVCKQRRPLAECDFESQEDRGQLTLWDEECSGMCFL